MSFAVTAYDTALNMNGNDSSGAAKIRIHITGLEGQKLVDWGTSVRPTRQWPLFKSTQPP